MKSKNMTLMMVAVGCGLVAAFLTARLSGSSTPDTVNVLVAKKELPVGTKIDPKEIDAYVAISSRPKADVPQDSILDVEQLKGKQLNRTLKIGDRFSTGDVGDSAEIPLPEGTSKVALRVDQVSAVAGFVQPGSKVDVIMTEQVGSGKVTAGFVLRDMLVLAVDTFGRRPEGDGSGRTQVSSVSLAVTPKQSLFLAAAERRGKITLLLRDPENPDKTHIVFDGKIPGIDQDTKATEPAKAPVEPKTAIAVAKVDVKLNTQIDDKNVNDFFVMKEFPSSIVPANAVKELKDLRNKFITKPLDADQIVMAGSYADAKVEVAQPTIVAAIPEPKKKPVVRKKIIQTIGSTHYLFVEVGPDDFRLVGPVTDLQGTTKPEEEEQVEEKKSDDKTKEEKKPEAKPMRGTTGETVTRK